MAKIYSCIFVLLSLTGFGQNKYEVFFDFNQDEPNVMVQTKLEHWIKENKDIQVTKLYGYCDSVDDRHYNKDLAMRRIQSVKKILDQNKIAINDNLELKSFGKDFKFSTNQTENRKVVLYYSRLNTNKPSIEKQDSNTKTNDTVSLVEEERATLEHKFYKAKKGDLIRIQHLNFFLNSEKIIPSSYPILDELNKILIVNSKLRIEIQGHICCNPNTMDTKLSYRRAIVIFKYLQSKGIPVNRMAFKGIGSNIPIYPIPEKSEAERAANRRVEILIVEK
jgi:outer membrane protein OmpA-like peptidoglycan-associated protein